MNQFPPPPPAQFAQQPQGAPPPPPPAVPPAAGYPAQPQQGYAAPAQPVYAPAAPQGYAAPPPAGVPVSYPQPVAAGAFPPGPGMAQPVWPQQSQRVQSNLNNARAGGGRNLFPQEQGQYRLQLIGFAYENGAEAGAMYVAKVRILGSSNPKIEVGTEYEILCKIARTLKDNAGDGRRKSILAACWNYDPNAQIDWNAVSDATEQRRLADQPMYCDLRMTTRFDKPIKDKTTQQPLPGQFWCQDNYTPIPAA